MTGQPLADAAALFLAEYPARAAEFGAWLREPSAIHHLARDDAGRVTGFALAWSNGNRRWRMELVVEPRLRRRSIGSGLLDRLVESVRRLDGITLQARAPADAAMTLGFLGRRGFRETMRMHRMVLDVENATAIPDPATEAALADGGVTIRTFADELADGDTIWSDIARLYDGSSADWPDPDPGGHKEPLTAAKVREMFARWQAGPDAIFIARCDGVPVGFSGLGRDARPIGTAVLPGFRGRGIATALKQRVIGWARTNGVGTLWSASGNPAMIRINERLGFQHVSTEVRLVRRLG